MHTEITVEFHAIYQMFKNLIELVDTLTNAGKMNIKIFKENSYNSNFCFDPNSVTT